MNNIFDIKLVIDKLKNKRKIFVSERDLQLEMALTIKKLYPNAKIRLEYCPSFDLNMHIDILVIIDSKWYPVELKYKTRGCKKIVDNEIFNLKNHGAKDVNSYLYLKDIVRIEKIKNNVEEFEKGYAVFITNDLSYMNKPNENVIFEDFSLENEITKNGMLCWKENASKGTMGKNEQPIILKGSYKLKWQLYSRLDNENNGTFMYLISEIK